jgi:hypothetical protein
MKRMSFWGWIVIGLSIVCVILGTLAMIVLAMRYFPNSPTTQQQPDRFVVSEPSAQSAKVYNEGS